jgi:hypothetical protein
LSRDVNERILAATTRGLERLGKNVSTVSYWKFKQERDLDANQIPTHSADFTECVSKLFGPGFKIVEASIAAELKKEFNLENVRTNDFLELVATVRNDVLKHSL